MVSHLQTCQVGPPNRPVLRSTHRGVCTRQCVLLTAPSYRSLGLLPAVAFPSNLSGGGTVCHRFISRGLFCLGFRHGRGVLYTTDRRLRCERWLECNILQNAIDKAMENATAIGTMRGMYRKECVDGWCVHGDESGDNRETNVLR